jgi:hypothetical protein
MCSPRFSLNSENEKLLYNPSRTVPKSFPYGYVVTQKLKTDYVFVLRRSIGRTGINRCRPLAVRSWPSSSRSPEQRSCAPDTLRPASSSSTSSPATVSSMSSTLLSRHWNSDQRHLAQYSCQKRCHPCHRHCCLGIGDQTSVIQFDILASNCVIHCHRHCCLDSGVIRPASSSSISSPATVSSMELTLLYKHGSTGQRHPV